MGKNTEVGTPPTDLEGKEGTCTVVSHYVGIFGQGPPDKCMVVAFTLYV